MNTPSPRPLAPPIPEPNGGLPQTEVRTFRLSPAFRVLYDTIFGGLGIVFFFWFVPVEELWPAASNWLGVFYRPVLIALYFIVSTVHTVVDVALKPIRVDRNGIEYPTDILRSSRLNWDQMGPVRRRFALPGLPVLRIGTRKRWFPFLLPIYLPESETARFIATLREFAPPDNPLRRYFEINTVKASRDTMNG